MVRHRAIFLVLSVVSFWPFSTALAVDTLDVKVSGTPEWTVFEHPELGGFSVPLPTRDGSLWQAATSGAIRYTDGAWVRYEVADGAIGVGTFAEAPDGTIWFAGRYKGRPAYARLDGDPAAPQAWKIFVDEAGSVAHAFSARALAVDGGGRLWSLGQNTNLQAGVRDRTKGGEGVIRFDPSAPADRAWRNFRVSDGLAHNRTYDLQTAPDGSVWICTLRGMSHFDRDRWTSYGRADGLGSPKGYGILPTRDGKVWVSHGSSLSSGGLSVFDGKRWKYLTRAHGMPVEQVRAICQDKDGALWFGTNPDDLAAAGASGLLRYLDGAWLRITRADGLPGKNTREVVQSADGSLWLAVPDLGLVRYRPQLSSLGTVSGRVTRPDGSPWTDVGVSLIDEQGQSRAGATTDSEGRYRLQAFPGRYRASVVYGRGIDSLSVTIFAATKSSGVDFLPERVGPGRKVPAGPGRTAAAGQGKGHWRFYDVTSGLPTGAVWGILEDNEGALWFGSDGGGVTRYDGRHFVTLTTDDGLVNNGVKAIYEDLDGSLWFGTTGGVSRYRDGAFLRSEIQDSLANREVRSVFRDRGGTLWFGTVGDGLWRYEASPSQQTAARKGEQDTTNAGTLTVFRRQDGLAGDTVQSIFQDRKGDLWFGGTGGVRRYDGREFTRLTMDDELAGTTVWSILQDRDDYMWLGTWGGLTRYDGRNLRSFTKDDGLPHNMVLWMQLDGKGDLWFGTWSGGLVRYDGESFETFTKGLNSPYVGPIHLDRQGIFWVGNGGGVTRYDPDTFASFGEEEGLPGGAVITSLKDRDGALWFGTAEGVTRYEGSAITTLTTDDGLAGVPVQAAFQDREGFFWFGTPNGLSRYDGTTFTNFTTADGLASNSVTSIAQDGSGGLWFGTPNGTSLYDGTRFSSFSTDDGLAGGATAITADRSGALWFGTGGGLSRFDGQEFVSYRSEDGLSEGTVQTVFCDSRGFIWAGTTDGVSRIDPAHISSGRDEALFETFTVDAGLVDNRVISILEDGRHHLWFGTEGGLSRYDPSKGREEPGAGRGGTVFQTMLQHDGLAGNRVNAMVEGTDGAIWIGTDQGATRYRQPDPTPPAVTIDAVVADRRHDGAAEVAVPSTVRMVAFEFGGASFITRPEGLLYHYRLKGFDDWQVTRSRRVEYQDLPRGDYTFQVEAVDRDLVYSAEPATASLTVRLPYSYVGWGSGLALALVLAAWQTARLIQRDRRLKVANEALSNANNELYSVNQDLQREQVLERLRGQAQGMQSSEDIRPVVEAVNRELTALGLPLLASTIGIYVSEAETEIWLTGNDGRAREPFIPGDASYRDGAEGPSREAHRRGDEYHYEYRDGEAARAFLRRVTAGGNPRWKDVPEEDWPQQWHESTAFFDGGRIRLVSEERIAEDDLMLVKRFGEVFGYAHSRYKELQEKEAQNRQLKNQNVLERLRGQAQGMQSSEDIGPVVEALYRELKALGLPMIQSSIDIMTSSTDKEEWTTSEDGSALEPVVVGRPVSSNPAREAYQRGDAYYHHHFDGRGRNDEIRQAIADGVERRSTDLELGRIFGNPRWKGVPEERWPLEAECYTIFFDGGYVSLVSEEPIADEYLMLIKRFGDVFEYAHSRREELKVKEAQNRRLAVDAAVQLLRAEVQSMDEASDFERILSLLTESLKTVELSFDGCEIDVLDEPVEDPTMAHFESNGFRYTTYTLDPEGRVALEHFALPAPFPAVNRQTIDRFIAGEPWQGQSDDLRIVEVPAGNYGRLRLTASKRDIFTDNEVATLRECADAVALGYARYLDIREIQDNTAKKSAFLASMSHELRTPMNAIKGFTSLVLRREKGMSDRGQENLKKVGQASDHLLALINDILDLSKIEAGHMEVSLTSFDVGSLIDSCAATVSPLTQDGVDLQVETDSVGEAHTDEARVRQMLINLLSNALKFTGEGRVTVKALSDNGQLILSVTDTGKGIPEDELPTIFDEYRQVKGSDKEHKGTGLGLSITKKFAELLGGSIGVTSEVGKGSTFTVKIPATYQEREAL